MHRPWSRGQRVGADHEKWIKSGIAFFPMQALAVDDFSATLMHANSNSQLAIASKHWVLMYCSVGKTAVYIHCMGSGIIILYLDITTFISLTLFRPEGGLWRPYKTLKLNNFKTVKAVTTKFSEFPKTYLAIF